MPRYDDAPTRLYVGHLSTRTRSRDLEAIFSRYGRIRDVDVKHDFAFVEFSDPRDADDARHSLNGRDFEGHRMVVEFARRGPRSGGGGGGGGSSRREYMRGPPPGTGRCYNCGNDGHWARDCKAGDWKDKCYRCGQRGHIERNCRNSPRSSNRYQSRSRSRSRSMERKGSHSRSLSRSPRRYSRGRRYSASPVKDDRSRSPARKRSMSPDGNPRRRDRSLSPEGDRLRSPKRSSLSPEGNRRSASPVARNSSLSPEKNPGGDEQSPAPRDRSMSPDGNRSPEERRFTPDEETAKSPSPSRVAVENGSHSPGVGREVLAESPAKNEDYEEEE